MTWLLQPPPLLAILAVVALAALAVERGVGLRRLAAALTRRVPSTEDAEVWGAPDPVPPAKRPLDYERLVEIAPPIEVTPSPGALEPMPEPEAAPVELLLEAREATAELKVEPVVEAEFEEVSLVDIYQRAQAQAEPLQQPATSETPESAEPAEPPAPHEERRVQQEKE